LFVSKQLPVGSPLARLRHLMKRKEGPILAVFLVILVILSFWLFTQRYWWMPELASVHGGAIDRVFMIVLVITGVLFIVLQAGLAALVFRFRERAHIKPQYWNRPRFEKRFAIAAGVLILIVDVAVFGLGESEWFKAWGPPPEGTAMVEVTGEQFMWNFRYPGKDGIFGKTEPRLISGTNPLGIDPADPASADDVLSTNQLHLTEGQPIVLRLRSKDVIHSFNLPNFRVKQDTVPGMRIDVWFIPAKQGQFEIACNQLCGLAHYRMRAFLTVEPKETFDVWFSQMAQGGK
jgi:cytochrome c oxidase subunit II